MCVVDVVDHSEGVGWEEGVTVVIQRLPSLPSDQQLHATAHLKMAAPLSDNYRSWGSSGVVNQSRL